MYLLGFNGPPRCGKDSLAKAFADYLDDKGCTLPVRVEYLSEPMRHIAYAMIGFKGQLKGSDYEYFKGAHWPQFDRDGRHLMIDVSESFMKPLYGLDIFARMLLERVKGFHGIVLVPDSGFQCEVSPLIESLGPDNVVIARVHRTETVGNLTRKYDFADMNDSREWVGAPLETDLTNEGTLEDLKTEAGRLYGRLVNRMGWVI